MNIVTKENRYYQDYKDVLLVEDNPADIRLIHDALKEDINNLYTVFDGSDAIEFLDKHCKSSKGHCPNIIILDLNLPKKEGIKVLEEIKNDEKLCKIPIIIFSTSSSRENIDKCYQIGANAYIIKPIDFNEFQKIMDNLRQFWLNVIELPL